MIDAIGKTGNPLLEGDLVIGTSRRITLGVLRGTY
jgi:hypothetical protein